MTTSKTAEKVAEMMLENTGTHFLDSGGANGRAWQQNQGTVFAETPVAVLEISKYGIEFTIGTYHFLTEKLTWDEEGNQALDEMEEEWGGAVKEGTRADYSYYEMHVEFPKYFAQWLAKNDPTECDACRGNGLLETEYEDGRVTRAECPDCKGDGVLPTEPMEVHGIYHDGDPVRDNTYNVDNSLSQDIIFNYFTLGESRGAGREEEYVAIQVHGGADARGGHTRPQIFTCNDELSVLDYARGGIGCVGDDKHPSVKESETYLPGMEPDEAREYSDHIWTTDDGGSSWLFQGSCGRDYDSKQLDKLEIVKIDAEEYESILNAAHENGLDMRDGEVYGGVAPAWVKGKLCYVEELTEKDGTKSKRVGYCPLCGGRLSGGMY